MIVLLGLSPRNQVEHWTVREEVRIGGADNPTQELTRVGDVLLGAGGLIYIAQPSDLTIRVFDRTGRFLHNVGRKGEGPGEFRMLHSIGFLADTLYATDQSLRRVSLFSPDGTVARTYGLATPLIGSPPTRIYSPTVPTILLPDGTGIVRPSIPISWLNAGKEWIPIFRLMADGQSIDTITQAEYEVPNVVINSRGNRLGVPRPFSDAPIYELLADGTGILIVRRRAASATGPAMFQVVKIGLKGDTVFARNFQYEPMPLREPIIAHVIGEIHDRLARRPNPPARAEIREALRDGGHIPRMSVPVTDAASGLDGSIWLRRETTEARLTVWQVLKQDGSLRATVELGRNQSVKVFSGDALIVTDVDSLDVPFVIRYRIERGTYPE
jgi:hypothetical protein